MPAGEDEHCLVPSFARRQRPEWRGAMHWDLGSTGLLYLAGMSIIFGLVAQLLAWRAGPKWLGLQ
jgi:hypothetical protein